MQQLKLNLTVLSTDFNTLVQDCLWVFSNDVLSETVSGSVGKGANVQGTPQAA